MEKRASKIATVVAALATAGCGTPYIDAGAKLSQALESGNSILSKGVEDRATTLRQHFVLSPRAPKLPEGGLPVEFVALACAAYQGVPVRETIALGNVQVYAAAVKADTTTPKETDLGSTLSRLFSARELMDLPSLDKPAEELDAKLKKKYDACALLVRSDFITPAGAPSLAVLVAVYPKIKEVLTLIATQADKQVREERFKKLLTDESYQKSLAESLDALEKSGQTGQLSVFLQRQRQLALWSAYTHFITVTMAKPDVSYSELAKEAAAMSEDMAIYDKLFQTDYAATVARLREANNALVAAARRGQLAAGSDSITKQLIESLDFLVAAAGKYKDAQDAYEKARKK